MCPSAEDVAGHAQVVEAEKDGGLGEDAEDDAFAEEHGDDADAEVLLLDFAAAVSAAEGDAPSCGRRFSAMLRFAMILRRLMMAAPKRWMLGGTLARWRTPSMR